MGRSRNATARRAAWVVSDQLLSSLSNAGLALVVARSVSPVEYGNFAVAFTLYGLTVALVQAACGQAITVKYSGANDEDADEAGSAAIALAVFVGLAASLLTLASSITVNADLRANLLAMALLFPALVMQDLFRTIFVSRAHPKLAFLNDLIWVVLQVIGVSFVLAFRGQAASEFVYAWGGAALVAALFAVRQAGYGPRFAEARRFALDNRAVAVPSVANALAILGSTQIAFLLLAGIGGVEVIGALRAAQTLLGPLNIIGFAAVGFAMPEVIRRNLAPRQLLRVGIWLSLLLIILDLAWGTVLLFIPDALGRTILGATWVDARKCIPGLIAFACTIASTTGATAMTRAMNRPTLVLVMSAVLGPLVIVCSALGFYMRGASGAASGFAVAGALVIAPTWWLLRSAVHRAESDLSIPQDGD